ncbi:hypothetical protein C8Q70DRAFT_1059060 [Cubamyces menziesii]|nr:hypothetical protein C8Q70DRAFT_1059060 [Cubamyces menziesii]
MASFPHHFNFNVRLLAETLEPTRMLASGALCATLADISLTTALTVALRQSRTGFKGMDSKIDIMILYSVNTGLITGIINLIFVVFAFSKPSTMLEVATGFVAVKMYAMTLLVALNSRQFIASRDGDNIPGTHIVFGSGGSQTPSLLLAVSAPQSRLSSGWQDKSNQAPSLPLVLQ